jgi:hypothetical protein
MNLPKSFLCGAMVLFIGIGLVLAQDDGGAEAVNQELKDSDMQWVWGEVANIDIINNVIILKYLDYEDNQDKEISIGVDSGTVYENIKSLDEIKPQDFLSIDYVIAQDGKNVAKNIGLDKLKESQAVGQGQVEATGQEVEAAGKQILETGQ